MIMGFLLNKNSHIKFMPLTMKNLTSSIAVFVTVLFLVSCGKEKKPEFTDENTGQNKTEEMKNDAPKKEEKKENVPDSVKQNNSRIDEYKGSTFSNEKPVAVISPLEAGDYNGKTVTVKGFVADVYQSDKVAYLNFVEKFPKNPFTAVIFASKFGDFPDIIKYRNKDVEVTGRVSMYREKAQIILNSPKQIVVK